MAQPPSLRFFAFLPFCFRACRSLRFHRRFFLRSGLIVSDGSADEILQGPLVDSVALEKIDRASLVAFEACVEELVGIGELGPIGKGEFDFALVRVGDRDHSVAIPHRASHMFPFLGDRGGGRKNALADSGERLAAPVPELRDHPFNTFRWNHGFQASYHGRSYGHTDVATTLLKRMQTTIAVRQTRGRLVPLPAAFTSFQSRWRPKTAALPSR